ncbi:hypothetical protein TNCV_326701 [Trichonephila clavipes]|nr:hypothetical protein TNCV_326701 [Trichonephila clavipes]
MGRILEVFPGSDGLVRVVNVKTSTGILKRAVTKEERGDSVGDLERPEERGGDLESRDQLRSDSESAGDFSDERRDNERRWCRRTGNNVLERWESALRTKD